MLWRAGLLIKWALVTALGLAVAVGCGGNPFFAAGFQIQPGGGTTGGTGGTQPGGGGGSSGLSRFITVHIENLTGQQIH